jgi:DNA-binding NtrC family response regulator
LHADIAVMAQQMVVDLIREKGLSSVPRFESAAQDFLSSHSWDHNYAQLRAMVRALMDTSPSELITLADLDAALKASAAASPRAQFEAHLTDIQLDYVQAVSILFGGDRVKVADFFGADLATTEALLK